MEQGILISLDIETDKNIEEIKKAIERGIYWGLDVKNIAPPKKVKINYCQKR